MNDKEWLLGVKLWYNDQDYLGAIRVWEESLDALDWGGPHEDELLLRIQNGNLGPDFSALLQLHSVSFGLDVARRLLFLAGCQLDVPNVQRGRRSIVRCLRCFQTRKDWNSTLAQRAIQEWISSYDDEVHVTNTHWNGDDKEDAEKKLIISRRIVDLSMNMGCTYWTNPYQRPGFLDQTLRDNTKPFYNDDEKPAWCSILEKNWERIRDEFRILAQPQQGFSGREPKGSFPCQDWPSVGASDHRNGSGEHDHKVVDGDWREVVLFGTGAQPHLAPWTSNLIRTHVPEATELADQGGGEVIFSVLGAHTRIRPHCGSTNVRLTAHLGLSIPSTLSDECAIRVGDQWHTWENGRVMVFDDSFEHEVRNLTSKSRAVLLLRFWNPHLSKSRRASALEEAVSSKEIDIIRRYNPPIPYSLPSTIEQRALEQSYCVGCSRNGYRTIRIESISDASFSCSCGLEIL